MGRWWRAVAAASAVGLLGAAAPAQEDEMGTTLDSFYGKQSFQQIAVGGAPYVLPGGGIMAELNFGFNTLSRRIQPARHWKNYYGVSLDFLAGQDIAFNSNYYGDTDLDLWGAALLIESKLFYSDQARVRPYLGMQGGFGFGGLALAGFPQDVDPPSGRLNFYRFGVEAGMHVILNERFALVIADTVSANFAVIDQASFLFYPSTIFVGVVRWQGLAEGRTEE